MERQKGKDYTDYSRLDDTQRAIIIARYRDALHFTTPIHASACAAHDLCPARCKDSTRSRVWATVLTVLVFAGEVSMSANGKTEQLMHKTYSV